MALQTITAPVSTVVTLAEAKKHLRVTHTSEDDLIDLYLRAATAACENWMGRALIKRTYELTVDKFNDDGIVLPFPPIMSVLSVKYDDASGNEQTLVEDIDYYVDAANEPGWLLTTGTWPTLLDSANAVRVRYTAGYVDDASSPVVGAVPDELKIAVLLTLGTLYTTRETVVIGSIVTTVPNGAKEFMRAKRVDLGMA